MENKSFTHQQKINGNLTINYDKNGFITIQDDITKQSVKLHHTAIKILNSTNNVNKIFFN